MSRKRPREDDDFELCTEGDEVNDDALSITLSELDPASSPFKVSPVSSPGHQHDNSVLVWNDDSNAPADTDTFNTSKSQDHPVEQDPNPSEPLELSIHSVCVDDLDESFSSNSHCIGGILEKKDDDGTYNENKEEKQQVSYACEDIESDSMHSENSLYDEELEVEDDDIETNDQETKEKIPLYKGAPISVDESLLLVLTYAIRHNLSGAAIVDLLELISLHCREENKKMKTSLYFFKKHFAHLKAPVKLHYFCSDCYEPLESQNSQCVNAKDHKQRTKCSYFLEISLKDQVETHFKRKGFAENMQHRFNRVKVHPDNIEDIYDGQLYKEQVQSGFLSEENKFNFSLTWNTDGVPVFISSRTSMWPVYFVFNELPFKMRFKKGNILLGGIWYGCKPRPNLVIQPFLTSLKVLKRGVEVQPYGSDSKVITKGILLCGTADLPAKADFMGLKHPSGSFSCAVCKIEGQSVIAKEPEQKKAQLARPGTSQAAEEEEEEDEDDPLAAPSGSKKKKKKKKKKKRVAMVWVFPYSNQLELRQHKETEKFAAQALEKRKLGNDKASVCGVKWPTYVSKIMPDMIRGFGIDDLHHTYHGVFHKLLELWTLPKYKDKPWSIHKHLALVDRRLQNVHLPNFVQGGVPSITNLSLWKGKHYKTFMLYLALPVLERILPNVYLDHFACFVNCIFILNSSSISPSDLLHCSEALDTFVRQFEEFYGVRHLTINVHNTLHLAFICNNLGPMRCYSCFPFESLNGEVLRMIHGTRFVQIQLANCAYYIMSLPHELETCGSSLVQEFAYSLHHSYQKIRILEVISTNCSAAGNYLDVDTLSDKVKMFLQSKGFNLDSCKAFTKLKKDSILFVAQCYQRATKTESCFVTYISGESKCYGTVLYFVTSFCQGQCKENCDCSATYHAVIQQANVRNFSSLGNFSKKVKHILRYVLQEEVQLIPIDNLLHVCFSLSIPGKDPFLCERVNWLEIE